MFHPRPLQPRQLRPRISHSVKELYSILTANLLASRHKNILAIRNTAGCMVLSFMNQRLHDLNLLALLIASRLNTNLATQPLAQYTSDNVRNPTKVHNLMPRLSECQIAKVAFNYLILR